MANIQMTIIRLAFNAIIAAVGRVKPEDWAKVGQLVIDFLQKIQSDLPVGNPLVTTMSAFKAPASLLVQPKPKPAGDPWAN